MQVGKRALEQVIESRNPATGEVIWQGVAATAEQVDATLMKARKAFLAWSQTSFEQRLQIVTAYQQQLESHKAELAEAIAKETGKVLWDAAGEVAATIGKTAISALSYQERTGTRQLEINGMEARLTHRPHGILAVFGPYNFPIHLPNAHIVPALLAGNVIVFKPSELTPFVAEKMLEYWQKAGLPEGVIQILQGGRETGVALAGHPAIDGLLFTGSSATGMALHQQFAGQPQKILALEMGGNNPLIVWDAESAEAAAYHTVLSAFITTGQRCTCTRRLILPEGREGDAVLEALLAQTQAIRVGAYTDSPEPFMGALISNREVERVLAAQQKMVAQGAKMLLPLARLQEQHPFVSAGILDVTAMQNREDTEYFAPFLQVIRVANLDAAIAEANNTAYGLAAGIFTRQPAIYERCLRELRAGVINWNRQTTGASSALPFGGIGISGNHRPAGLYAADYCAYPVASLESETLTIPAVKVAGLG
jgi:succinylglutamic semialdehyde dehydrogenase